MLNQVNVRNVEPIGVVSDVPKTKPVNNTGLSISNFLLSINSFVIVVPSLLESPRISTLMMVGVMTMPIHFEFSFV